MRYAFCLETLYTDLPFVRRLARAREDGVETIEIWDWHDKEIDPLAFELRRLGMKMVNMSGNRKHGMLDPAEQEPFVEELEETARAAKRLACPNLMLLAQSLQPDGSGAPVPSDVSPKTLFDSMAACAERAGRVADEHDLGIVIEPLNDRVDHPGYWLTSSKTVFEAVRLAAHPRVKVLYDIYHMAMMGEDVLSEMEKNLDLIGHIHVADMPGRHEPGTGEIEWDQILRRLESLGYSRTIGFEFFPEGESGSVVRRTVERYCVY